MKKLFPILLALLGVGGGIGAGMMFRPDPSEIVEINPCGPEEKTDHAQQEEENLEKEYAKLNNQFVVPIVNAERVTSMVVLSLSIEVKAGQREGVFSREPKLRDAFLRVLFDHANMGGFQGSFTESNTLDVLRRGLLNVAQKVLGPNASDVLITDIARQDV